MQVDKQKESRIAKEWIVGERKRISHGELEEMREGQYESCRDEDKKRWRVKDKGRRIEDEELESRI